MSGYKFVDFCVPKLICSESRGEGVNCSPLRRLARLKESVIVRAGSLVPWELVDHHKGDSLVHQRDGCTKRQTHPESKLMGSPDPEN